MTNLRLADAFRAIAQHHEDLAHEFAALALELGAALSSIPRPRQTIDPASIKLDDLELSVRTSNCLKRFGVTTLADLIRFTPKDVLKINHLGRRSFNEITEVLDNFGLKLADER